MTDSNATPAVDPDDPQPLRYRQAPDARLQPGTGADRSEYFLTTGSGHTLALGEHERYLWQALDGTKSFAEIDSGFSAEFGIPLPLGGFTQFLGELLATGAIVPISENEPKVVRVRFSQPLVRKVELGASNGAGNRDEAASSGAGTARGGGEGRAGQSTRGQGRSAPRRNNARRQRVGFREAMKRIWCWHLGNPDRFFSALARAFWPIHQISWLLIPCIIMGFLITYEHWNSYLADWGRFFPYVPQWPVLWAAEHFTTWTGKIVEGTILYGFGATIKRVDVKLFMGLFIRLHFEETTVGWLSRSQKLWAAASTILWRLFCWSFFMGLWLMYRPTRPVLADIFAIEAFMGMASFLFCICPFIPLYGYKFLEVWTGEDHLWGRAMRYFVLVITGRSGPAAFMSLPQRFGLVFMAIGVTVGLTYFIGNMMYHVDVWTIQNFGGLGASIAIIHTSFCAIYFYRVRRVSMQLREPHESPDLRTFSVQPEL